MPTLSVALSYIEPGAQWEAARAWVESSAPGVLTASAVVLPDAPITIAPDGTGSVVLAATPADVMYQVRVEYRLPGARGRQMWRSGWFPFTADGALHDLATVAAPVPPGDWRDAVRTEVLGATADAQAAAAGAQQAYADAQALVISDLGTTDGQTRALIEAPASQTAQALTATIAAAHGLYYANVYDGFFAGKNSAADTSVPTIWANSTHLTDAGLRAWADYIVAMLKPDGTRVITGTSPKVVWIGDSWIDQGDDTPILHDAVTALVPGATVVVKGIGGQTSTQVLARFDTDVPADADFVIFNEPGVNDATINGGPTNGLDAEGQLANLRTWVRKIHAIGAVPIWTGHVPLTDWPRAAEYHQRLSAIVGDGSRFPAAAPEASWSANVRQPLDTAGAGTSIGYGPALAAAGVGGAGAGPGLTAAGVSAGNALTTGSNNTAIGHQALTAATTDVDSTAVGSRALAAQRGDGQNTAIGSNAGRGVTTGTLNTIIGLDAGYRDAALSAGNAVTTGTENTLIGNWSGATAGDVYCATAVGNRTKVGYYSTAIGYNTKAIHNGGVAIGVDGTGTAAETAAANFIALGTANHTVHIVGKLRLDRNQATVGGAGGGSALPASPVKYASVWGGDGTEYVVPLYAKA